MTLHVATASAVSSGTSSSGKARWWLWQIKHQRWQLEHVFIYICKSSETTTENESQPCSADFSWSTIKAMLNTVISQQAGLIMDIMEWFKWSLVVLTDLPGQADRPPPRLISSPSWKTSFWTVPSPDWMDQVLLLFPFTAIDTIPGISGPPSTSHSNVAATRHIKDSRQLSQLVKYRAVGLRYTAAWLASSLHDDS